MSESSNPIPFNFGLIDLIDQVMYSDKYINLKIVIDGDYVNVYEGKKIISRWVIDDFKSQVLPFIENKEAVS